VTQIVNGLAATPARRALLRAISDGRGRISYDPAERTVYDHDTGIRVTSRCKELVSAGWIRALEPGEERGPAELRFRTYYRLTDYGRAALKGEAR
jgi:hypothetical protein